MILFYSYLALGAFLVSLLGTRLIILGLRTRKVPVPMSGARGGGLAAVFALLIFLLLGDASYWPVLGMLLLAAVSLMHDWIPLARLTRFCVQVLAVLVAMRDVQIPALEALMPHWMAEGVIMLAWLWFINLFNLMDGIDGQSAAEMISISAGLVLITALLGSFSDPLSLHALIILGAGFGFWWNWHPARVRLGGAGCIPIGYLLGYVLLMAAKEGYVYAALILPAYYLTDAALTLLTRLWRKEKILEAHFGHFYQRAVRGGLKHDVVVIIVFGINMLLAMLAVLAELDPKAGWLYLSIAYGMVGAVLFFFMARPIHASIRS